MDAAAPVEEPADRPVTEADWVSAQRRAKKTGLRTGLVALPLGMALSLLAIVIADTLAKGLLRLIIALGTMVVLYTPMIAVMTKVNRGQTDKSDELVRRLTRQLAGAVQTADHEAEQREILGRRRDFEGQLSRALEMAVDEPGVIEVIERAFTAILPDTPVELLLADNSHAHLLRVASVSPRDLKTGCDVDSPEHCPAARRAQTQYFASGDALDACPKLRDRIGGPLSAMCVPVSIMGRTVGVIHSTDGPNATVTDDAAANATTLAKLAGSRLGLIRVMAESQLQASTDSLTGLLNRRSFEQRVAAARRDNPQLTLAMLDLDHFKVLNDTYGHETGDRALRLFAQVLTGSVRAQDVVGRHGGEEFVVALVGCTASSAGDILQSLRTRLDAAITVAALPAFTVSGGAVEAGEDESFPSLTRRADENLFKAKDEGRNRIVIRDAVGRTVPTTSPSGPAEADYRRVLREPEPV